MRATAETMEPQLRQKQHKVSVISSYEHLYVSGDFTRLVQCVANILGNAVKYTDPGGEIQDQEGTRVAGFDDHVAKPVSLAALERILADG